MTCLLLSSIALSASAQDGAQFTSFAGFDLGKATIAQVIERLGPAQIMETGNAGEYEAKICYRLPSGEIYFLSGETGGRLHDLLGFGISNSSASPRCAAFHGNNIPSLQRAGLHLGITKAEFSHVVDGKVRWSGNVGRVTFESRRPMTAVEFSSLPKKAGESVDSGQSQAYFDVIISVAGTFIHGKLSGFRVWKVATL